jgi:hypothetical protein
MIPAGKRKHYLIWPGRRQQQRLQEGDVVSFPKIQLTAREVKKKRDHPMRRHGPSSGLPFCNAGHMRRRRCDVWFCGPSAHAVTKRQTNGHRCSARLELLDRDFQVSSETSCRAHSGA